MGHTFGALRRLFPKRPVTFTGRNYRIARRLLLDIVDILNEAGVPYHVDSGTLLGLVRDGDLIPWDGDIDLGILAEDLEAFRATLGTFRRRGWCVRDERYVQNREHPAWTRGMPRAVKIRNRSALLLGRGRIYAEFFIKYPHGDGRFWSFLGKISRADRAHFDRLETVEYAGRPVKVPADYEPYLATMYGDWRTPRRDYDTLEDDGMIIR